MQHRLITLALVAASSWGCAPASPAAQALGGPDIVLDGTDVFEAASYSLTPINAAAQGAYRAEQGGSDLSLSLRADGANWQVERTYREPGSSEERRAYSARLIDGILLSEGGDLEVHGTADGVLVLERASEGSIPADYWILYVRP